MDKNEQRISWYSSLLIALMVNIPKLLALRENGVVARFWHFDPLELLFQFALNLVFCWLIFYLNLNHASRLSIYREQKKIGLYYGFNCLVFLISVTLGGILQHKIFPVQQLPRVYLFGCFLRFGLSGILVAILIQIMLLIRNAKRKDVENEQLKMAYMETELELLKAQMNPHFLFNSLSSLSGVIRENPALAQKYVRDLSMVFRYALVQSKNNLVTLDEELTMLRSFAQLITMRLENAFQFTINVPQNWLLHKLPHLALQPLLENAVKHNGATLTRPLKVDVFIEDDYLVLQNSIYSIPRPENSTGLGLANLNERFKIMVHKEIKINETEHNFMVRIPLKA